MSDKKFSLILWYLTQALVEKIQQDRNLDFHSAIKLLVMSQTYAMLEKQDNDLWQFGAVFLYKVLENEFATQRFEMPDVIL
jgi:hypothetical protein